MPKNFQAAALAGLAGTFFSIAGHACGPTGHQLIGAIADTQLTPAAKAAVGSSNLHADRDGVASAWDPLHPTPKILALARAVPATAGARLAQVLNAGWP